MKAAIKELLRAAGYHIQRYRLEEDCFAYQQALTKSTAPVIFDVGAHIGQVASDYRRLFPEATIHTFEPFPGSSAQLKERFRDDQRVFVHELAVSDTCGILNFNSNAVSATNSLLNTDSRANENWGAGTVVTDRKVQVMSTTIDRFCDQYKIEAIDILKLDIQGAELAALRGAANMLSRHAIRLIYMEIIMVPTYEQQGKLYDYLILLDHVGYQLLNLYHPAIKNKQLLQVDAIFVPSPPN